MEILLLIGIVLIVWYVIRVRGKSKIEVDYTGNKIDRALKNSESLINNQKGKLIKYSEKKISKSYITGCSWVLSNNNHDSILYTFRSNNELLLTKNGVVEKATYELIIDSNSILITENNVTEHYNIVNMENDILFLNKVSTDKIFVFVNQTKLKDEMKSAFIQGSRELLKKEAHFIESKNNNDYLFNYVYDNWKNINPNKSILNFITSLEDKTIYDSQGYVDWLKLDNGNTSHEYAKYLVEKKYNC